ncbi:MAG: tetratricopeptide repeat protein [Planctomycetota bacterium]
MNNKQKPKDRPAGGRKVANADTGVRAVSGRALRARARWIVGIALVTGIIVSLWFWFRPGLDPVLPLRPERLNPQVRAYIEAEADRVRQHSRSAASHGLLGYIYYVNGMGAEAYKCFEQALQLDASHGLSALYLSHALRNLGDHERAIRELRALVAREPDNAAAYEALGKCLVETGDLVAGRAAYDAVVRLRPNLPFGYVGCADVLLRSRDAAGAIVLLEKAVRLAPRISAAFHQLGLAQRELGQAEAARDSLRRATQADPDAVMPEAWSDSRWTHAKGLPEQLSLMQQLVAGGRSNEGRAVMNELLRWNPENFELLNNCALLCVDLGQFDFALSLLDRAERAAPGRSETRLHRAIVARHRLDFAAAHEHLNAALQLAPEMARGYRLRAEIFLAEKRPNDALRELKIAQRFAEESPGLYMQLGAVSMELGAHNEALDYYRVAARLDPDRVLAHLCAFEAAIKLGNREAALKSLATARELDPNNPNVQKAINWVSRPAQ